MRYRVRVQPSAEADLHETYRWIAERSPEGASRWYGDLLQAISSLERFPRRCPVAPESEAFEEEIRQLLYRRPGGTWRVLFTLRGDEVHILHVRHAARRSLGRDKDS